MKSYEGARVAVDAVIFSVVERNLQILVHRREKAPGEGLLELPGGLLAPGESADRALERKLRELIPAAERRFFTQFHTFTEPERDPRTRTISIAYVALVPQLPTTTAGEWVPFGSLKKMAFDHLTIAREARLHLKRALSISLMQYLLPAEFPLNQLQELLEIVSERPMDNRNFRRWALSSGEVEETGNVLRAVSHRPAQLFRIAQKE